MAVESDLISMNILTSYTINYTTQMLIYIYLNRLKDLKAEMNKL